MLLASIVIKVLLPDVEAAANAAAASVKIPSWNSSASVPAVKSVTISWPRLARNTNVSLPEPPDIVSLPAPPATVSFQDEPVIVSLPDVPRYQALALIV